MLKFKVKDKGQAASVAGDTCWDLKVKDFFLIHVRAKMYLLEGKFFILKVKDKGQEALVADETCWDFKV